MTFDLRHGRWQDVLADVECDALVCDPPYSQRTEDGFRTSADLLRRGLGYAPITEDWCEEFVRSWHPRVRSWIVVFGDHISIRWLERCLSDTGRYVFQPMPIVKIGAAPRLQNDGPASQSEWFIVARPRERRFMSWGSLPGWYAMQTVRHGHGSVGVSGAKSLDLMRSIVRDYSRPGDLVCDPCAGGGTTLLAAAWEGRRSIGAEVDLATWRVAQDRIQKSAVPVRPLFQRAPAEQLSLLGEER